MKKRKWVLLLFVFINAISIIAYAAENKGSVEDRLNRLERLVNSSGLVDILVRVESMQSELQRLLGEIELQKHNLEDIKKRQRDLYIDIDRRLLQVERSNGSNVSSDLLPQTKNKPVESKKNKTKITTVPKSSVSKRKNNKKSEQVAYQKSFDLLRALRYEKATKSFRAFLIEFPNGRYAHIAQYWLAETSYHTRKYEIAVQDYHTLINQYPKSPKRADALLKIGYSQYELKSYTKAKNALQKLIQSYPGTTEAGQAANLLQKIRLKKSK